MTQPSQPVLSAANPPAERPSSAVSFTKRAGDTPKKSPASEAKGETGSSQGGQACRHLFMSLGL
jgi:hypothetical protein